MPSPGEPGAVKVARRVRRGGSGNLLTVGGFAVRHPEDRQGARLLPNSEAGKAGHRAKGTRGKATRSSHEPEAA